MKLIVGLGNPGIEYEMTRHNAGFLVVDRLIKEHALNELGLKFKSMVYSGTIHNEKIVVIKPLTYMNLSGDAVIAAKNFYKMENQDILIAYDDFELPLGTLRIKATGSAGTHNGMKDIILKLGTNEIPRLRIGIGPKPLQWQTKDFVLSTFASQELPELKTTIGNAQSALNNWVTTDIDNAMRHCN
ncbi:MAG: aminoacyl-tRNA hydrolase [bacterium]|nr:aminoacyl-tRNA hydrolase [bacterium]